MDTRASRDGEVFIHHDHCTDPSFSQQIVFDRTPAATIRRITFPNGEHILSLDEGLALFAARKHPGQKLCLDLKDFGFEEEHLRLVRYHGLEASVVFVSWAPQVLLIKAY